MNILQTISSFGIKSGGTTSSTYDLLSALNKEGCQTEILTLLSPLPNDITIGNGEKWIHCLPNDAKTPFAFSKNLKNFLAYKNNYDIYHTNGLWMYCNHITAKTAKKRNKPFVITTHGMLYPQALARSRWKKELMLRLFFNKEIHCADCIHATCKTELEHIRNFGYKGVVAVVPNPVSINEVTNSISPQTKNPKQIGFLGRIHEIKNIDRIIYAWAKLDPRIIENAELLIAGSGDAAYENELRNIVRQLNLKNVRFIGFIEGRKKYDFLNNLSALFVPSDTENFGMIVAEALLMRTPVMASVYTPWEELNTHRCGWWVDNDIDTIKNKMQEALCLSDADYQSMGNNGRKLIEEKYSDTIVAAMMKQLYTWILNGKKAAENPPFVY